MHLISLHLPRQPLPLHNQTHHDHNSSTFRKLLAICAIPRPLTLWQIFCSRAHQTIPKYEVKYNCPSAMCQIMKYVQLYRQCTLYSFQLFFRNITFCLPYSPNLSSSFWSSFFLILTFPETSYNMFWVDSETTKKWSNHIGDYQASSFAPFPL